MISAHAVWVDHARFAGIAGSRHALMMDSASSEKTASSPMEMILIALCGCTVTDVVSILQKKREPLIALEVRAEADQAPSLPRCIPTSVWCTKCAGACRRRRWKMQCTSPRTSIAQYRKCSRRRLPLLFRLNTNNTYDPRPYGASNYHGFR
jgi:putative redox protein